MGFPLILCLLLLACHTNKGLCRMSDKEQDKPQECSADDVEMDSQLTDAVGESQGIDLMEEECGAGHQGDDQQAAEGDEQMSQDGDIEPVQRDTELAATPSGDHLATEPIATPSSEQLDTELVATPSGDQSKDQEAVLVPEKEEEAVGVAAEAKAEEMALQGSDSEPKAKPSFPNTLKGFGYHFKGGKLRLIETDKPFQFEVSKDKKYNQAHYEAIGELKPKKNEPMSFIYRSEDALTNRNKLMLLIHGSGVVRAGQWARSLIINDCIDSGTQIPYIKRAMEEGYGVIVFNTNYNNAKPGGASIRGSGSPLEHAQYVWKHFVKEAKAKRIYIVAHSFGGVVTVDLMVSKFDEFKKRVHKIAFTDSVHILHSKSVSHIARKWIIEHAVNWVTSDRPLNEELKSHLGDVSRRSAGTQKHVETSWFSFEHIFAFFSETET